MNFFKTFLASVLGVITSVILMVIVLFALVMMSSSEPEPQVKAQSVLTISFSGDIPAYVQPNPVAELFDPSARYGVSLETLKSNLKKAAADDNIEGVWITTNFVYASWVNLETAYGYLEKFKESGKFLIFSTDDIGMNEKAYYLASIADGIYSPPETNFEFDGFVIQRTFYADMLDKIGIEPEIFRVGKYKSAVEPYIQTSSSPESRQQMEEIMASASSAFIDAVSKRTGKTSAEIHEMLNSEPIARHDFAYNNGLIDSLIFENDVEKLIKKSISVDEDDELETISFKKYSRISDGSAGLESNFNNDKIAVIYTEGVILPNLGESPFGGSQTITAKNVQKQLDKALKDSKVKAIVVHINSPGGSAPTSDLIWNSLKQASEKKPVIASMGSVAASGGYYMAMGADTVVAGANTITGSIGIFSLLFNAQELMEEKIGLDYETMTTHEYADLYDLTEPLTQMESRIIQQNVENGYESFLKRVANARGMTRDEVHDLAQGRVYTGQAAKEVGLIDIIGDIETAIETAAEMASMEAYRLDIYPKEKGLYEAFFSTADSKVKHMVKSWLPSSVQTQANDISILLKQPEAQNWALLPVHYDVD